jgi:Bacterial regulatory proteins, tetR family
VSDGGCRARAAGSEAVDVAQQQARARTGRPRASVDGRTVPERLLFAATALFANQGFEGTSVQEIVGAAGVTKGGDLAGQPTLPAKYQSTVSKMAAKYQAKTLTRHGRTALSSDESVGREQPHAAGIMPFRLARLLSSR